MKSVHGCGVKMLAMVFGLGLLVAAPGCTSGEKEEGQAEVAPEEGATTEPADGAAAPAEGEKKDDAKKHGKKHGKKAGKKAAKKKKK